VSEGFRRIAFVGGEITLSAARERLSGYARALAEAEIKPEPSWICLGGMDVEEGYRQMENLLKREDHPDAMVAVNLLVHLGMERCLLDMNGFNVNGSKQPVVIAGFDETRYTPFLPACRYVASQDAVGMGRRAGQRIIEMISEKKTLEYEDKKTGDRVIRLPVTISCPIEKTALTSGMEGRNGN